MLRTGSVDEPRRRVAWLDSQDTYICVTYVMLEAALLGLSRKTDSELWVMDKYFQVSTELLVPPLPRIILTTLFLAAGTIIRLLELVSSRNSDSR